MSPPSSLLPLRASMLAAVSMVAACAAPPAVAPVAPQRPPAAASTPGPAPCSEAHSEACLTLGRSLATKTDPTSRAEAYRDFALACAARQASACVEAGRILNAGRGVETDYAQGQRDYRLACDLGDMHGCGLVAVALVLGAGGVRADPRAAHELGARACDGGAGEGCIALARLAEKGSDEARRFNQKACDLGDAYGCWNLVADEADSSTKPGTLALIARACAGGAAQACWSLGRRAAQGLGVARDDAEAARRFEQACDGGEPAGCGWLGQFAMAGRGVPVDQGRAVELLARACDHAIAWACGDLGVAVAQGKGVARDAAHATDLLDRACAAGTRSACFSLLYDLGLYPGGLNADRSVALGRLDAACKAKSGPACSVLGGWLRRRTTDADHVTRASEALAAACELGEGADCAAAYDLEVRAKLPARPSLLEAGCARKGAGACVALAKALSEGRDVARDAARAEQVARGACDANVTDACELLADFYEKGTGPTHDLAKAASLHERGCQGGWPKACRALAAMVRAGRGVARDLTRAKALDDQASDLED